MSIAKDITDNQNLWSSYRDGAEGYIRFIEDRMRVQIYPMGQNSPEWVDIKNLPKTPHPETGRSWADLWENHKKVMREALVNDETGNLKHRLIVLCWPRGDGKSFCVVSVVIWRFFCFPKQTIALCANSKDQSTFVHMDEIKKYILNSPKLLSLIGRKNVLDKKIRIKDKKGNEVSKIFSATTFSGIFSNINLYTFSEIFDLSNEGFFNQIDGSIRNIPNSFGIIDTTVSPKSHFLYRLYKTALRKKDRTIYFSYRYSQKGDQKDYWHPLQTDTQLNSYKLKQPFGFVRQFLNLWSSGADQVFTIDQIDAISYLGYGGQLLNQKEIVEAVKLRAKYLEVEERFSKARTKLDLSPGRFLEATSQLLKADDLYALKDQYNKISICSVENLRKLGDLFNTDWAILVGADFADPLKTRTAARSILTVVAKGLPGSRINPEEWRIEHTEYVYLLIGLFDLLRLGIEEVKKILSKISAEYTGIDKICSERWRAWDLPQWCEEEDIPLELVYPTKPIQLSAFTGLYTAINSGRFKAPKVYTPGSKGDDILREEMAEFDHDEDKQWFGSKEKKRRYGVQDDVMYSLAWTIYGGRLLTPDDFRTFNAKPFFGRFYPDNSLVGNY